MKKFLLMVAAVATMALAACSGEQKSNDVEALGETLKEQIANGDKEGIMQTMSTIQSKIAELATPENLAALKEELPKYQQMLNDNKEQILAVIGNNETVANLLNTVATIDAGNAIDAVASQLGNMPSTAAETAQDKAEEALENAQDKAAEAVSAAEEAAAAAVQSAQDKADEAVQAAKDKANAAVEDAQNKAADALKDAAGKLKF